MDIFFMFCVLVLYYEYELVLFWCLKKKKKELVLFFLIEGYFWDW